jgi:hypothetical protein
VGKVFPLYQKSAAAISASRAALAELTGESKQGINKKLAEARKLGDTLKRLADHSAH